MFCVGQVVRLVRGWTPMIVIFVNPKSNFVIAKYANNPNYPVSKDDLKNPHTACGTQKRHFDEFTLWDGDPIDMKVYYPMTYRYKSKASGISGTLLNRSSKGDFIIEDDAGHVFVIQPDDAVRDIPFTFAVRSSNSNYTCNYTLPDKSVVNVGDVLVSESGNFYIVTKLDTQCPNPKGQFKGYRVLKELL